VTVYFTADVAEKMPWTFKPMQQKIKVKIGEKVLAFYIAKNPLDKAVVGVATYNVTPARAGLYFNKIQCFCFDEQRLRPHDEILMPVYFFLDPKMASDPKMRKIEEITLSYTFFRIESQDE